MPARSSAAPPVRGEKRGPARGPARRSRVPWPWRLIRWGVPKAIYWGAVAGLWLAIAAGGVVAYYAAKLPSADTWAVPERPPDMTILAADGSVLGHRGVTGGRTLRLEEMSPHIAKAVIAIEDRRFHAHFGFDPVGFTRAMVRNALAGRTVQGGSTLTQQLAKNLFLSHERSLDRKVQELVLAFWLEWHHSKAEILEMYLNRVYFGAGATGVDAAARRYFGKSARHVTLAEAALLAGLLKAPSRYAPTRDPALAKRRARVVVAAMQREGYVAPGPVSLDRLRPGEVAAAVRAGPEQWAADRAARRVTALVSQGALTLAGDVTVETTVDPFLTLAAHSHLEALLDEHGRRRKVGEAALIVMAPDGGVRATIGGRDRGASQFDRVFEARRQPGSAFKPFVWTAAVERGYRPATTVVDEPVTIGRWTPANHDRRHRGAMPLGRALAASVNTVAASLTAEGGVENLRRTARRLGIASPLGRDASLSLGTSEVRLSELTAAYAAFANGGRRAAPYLVTRIRDARGRVLWQRRTSPMPAVLDAATVGAMNAMLSEVVRSGTGRKAALADHAVAGKTGTSQAFRDALFVGHTGHLVGGVWMGNDDNRPMHEVTGGSLPATLWRRVMADAHRGLAPRPLPGEGADEAILPTRVATPTFRPGTARERPSLMARADEALRERVRQAAPAVARRTIVDLILGR